LSLRTRPGSFSFDDVKSWKVKKRSPSMCVCVCTLYALLQQDCPIQFTIFFFRCVYASVLCTKVERIVGPLLHLASEKRDSINRYLFWVEERPILLCIHTTDGPPLFFLSASIESLR
jgi:hypothetical protein